MCMYSACGGIQLLLLLLLTLYSLGFYCEIQTIRCPQAYLPTSIFMYTTMTPYTDISALLRSLMACEKAGTSFLGYSVTLLFLQRYSITASFVETVISFSATNTRILCICMASRNVALVAE